MASEKLYMESIDACYLRDFKAKVTAIDDNSVTLDRTLFYPLGGGQNWDTGIINWDGGKLEVTEVRGRGDIQHFVGEDHGLTVGEVIEGTIDWERRHAHMRMHTAQHLVSGLVYEMYDGARTVGNQIHTNRSRIDFNPIKFTEEIIDDLFHRANEVIESNLEVTDSIMTRDEINAIMPPDRTNMDLLPISVKQLRVVKIGNNADLCPCAGTHVRALREIGEMKFLGKKNKGKGTTRVSYTLEGCES
jgi:misacylated tRNA(Ala) deacylase